MPWPVQVFVTDRASGTPISGAGVSTIAELVATTDSAGSAVIGINDELEWVSLFANREGYNTAQGTAYRGTDCHIRMDQAPAVGSSPLQPPTNLRVTHWSVGAVTLAWRDPVSYSYHRLGWAMGGGGHQQVDLGGAALEGTVTSTELRPGARCRLKVQAARSDFLGIERWSAWSELDWTFPIEPPHPTGPIPADAQTQPLWRWCEKCKGLIYADPAATHMSAGVGVFGSPAPPSRSCNSGGMHRVVNSAKYEPFFGSQASSLVGKTQTGWRWCKACSALFFSGFSAGECNKSPSGHDGSASGEYYLYYERNPPGTQASWRWCSRCQALAFDDGTAGVCFDGGGHNYGGSGNYAVVYSL